jgi:hypothetical protein
MKKTTAAASPEAYVAALTGWQRDRVEALRALVREAAELEEGIKWGHLVYAAASLSLGHQRGAGSWRSRLSAGACSRSCMP